MVLYFLASSGFVLKGLVEYCAAQTREGELSYVAFIMAGLFGVASSMMLQADRFVSYVFHTVSASLFWMVATSFLVQMYHTNNRSVPAWMGHATWFVGTFMDVVISYYKVLGQFTYPQAVTSIVAATLWLVSSLFYLYTSIASLVCAAKAASDGATVVEEGKDNDGSIGTNEHIIDDDDEDDNVDDRFNEKDREGQQHGNTTVNADDSGDNKSHSTTAWWSGNSKIEQNNKDVIIVREEDEMNV
jgi:hypothetical protein